jgi:hypothetical protein
MKIHRLIQISNGFCIGIKKAVKDVNLLRLLKCGGPTQT